MDPARANDLKYRMRWVREFLKEDTMLTAEKALEAGIVDQIIMPGDPVLDEIFRIAPQKEDKK